MKTKNVVKKAEAKDVRDWKFYSRYDAAAQALTVNISKGLKLDDLSKLSKEADLNYTKIYGKTYSNVNQAEFYVKYMVDVLVGLEVVNNKEHLEEIMSRKPRLYTTCQIYKDYVRNNQTVDHKEIAKIANDQVIRDFGKDKNKMRETRVIVHFVTKCLLSLGFLSEVGTPHHTLVRPSGWARALSTK
jgi:hypothetical protein